MAWMRCDAMIKGWLTTAMEKDIRSSVKYATTSSEICNDLLEQFGKESAPRAYELKQILTGTQQAVPLFQLIIRNCAGFGTSYKLSSPSPVALAMVAHVMLERRW